MPSVAIVGQKGGSGKTTLVLHLATCAAYGGTAACVIDTDPQATAAAWSDWRGADYQPEVITSPHPRGCEKPLRRPMPAGPGSSLSILRRMPMLPRAKP